MAETFSEQVDRVVVGDVPETEPNTFADQVQKSVELSPIKKQSQENLSITEVTNPDTEGRIFKLAKESGYDPATVRVDPAKVENQLNSYKGGNDQLDDYYAKDMSNAAISGDDWGPLTTLQGVVQAFVPTAGLAKAAIGAAQDFKQTETYRLLTTEELSATSVAKTIGASAAIGVTNISKAFGQTMDLVAPIFIDKRRLDFADKNLEKVTVSADLEKWLRTKVGDTKFEELLSSAVESMGTMLAAAATGGESAVLPMVSFVAGVGKTTESIEGGATMTQALLAGAVSAGVEYWTEKIPIETMLDPAKTFLEKLVKGGIAEIGGELTATALEIFAIDQAILKKEHLTLDEIKQALYDTAIVSLMMTGAGTTATHPFVRDTTIQPPVRKEPGARRTLQERMEGADLTPPVEEAVATRNIQKEIDALDAKIARDISSKKTLNDAEGDTTDSDKLRALSQKNDSFEREISKSESQRDKLIEEQSRLAQPAVDTDRQLDTLKKRLGKLVIRDPRSEHIEELREAIKELEETKRQTPDEKQKAPDIKELQALKLWRARQLKDLTESIEAHMSQLTKLNEELESTEDPAKKAKIKIFIGKTTALMESDSDDVKKITVGLKETLQAIKEAREVKRGDTTPEQTLKIATNADVAPVVADINRQEQTVNSDKEFHQNLGDLRKAVSETKTAERSPTHMKEVLKSFDMTEDVYISSEGVKNLYQSHTDAEATEILESIGADPVTAQKTISTGEDTVVKKATVITMADELYNAISKDIKQAPASYTARELTDNKATENKQNSFVVLKENIDRSKKVNEEITRLTSELESIKDVTVTDKGLVQDAPLLLKSIADRLTLSGLDPVERLGNISIKGTAFQEFVARHKEAGTTLFQETLIEQKDKGFFKQAFGAVKDIVTGKIRTDAKAPAVEGETTEERLQNLEKQDRAFFQSQGGTPRGALSIEGEKKTIELFEGADLSTVLHEIGHIALEEYSAVERAGLANQDLIDDMKAVREWVGAKEGEEFTTEQEEQFARGFEAYLMEGKAPTTALRAAFERFRQMLTSMYKTAKALNVTLNDDIRAVFDRMLSANVEVETAAQAAGFVAKTENELDALGMNAVDKFNAKKLIEQVKNKAEAEWTKDRNKNRKKLLEQWDGQARRELRKEKPIYVTIDDIENNRIRYDSDELAVIRKEIEEGEQGKRVQRRDFEGNPIAGEWIVEGGTFPEYFTGKGNTKENALKVIDKVLAGKSLTDNERFTIGDLIESYRDEIVNEFGVPPEGFTDLGGEKFDRTEFINEYGKDSLDLLPANMTVEGGAAIDEVAATYGYDDGAAFVTELFDTIPFETAVEQRVDVKQANHDALFPVEDYFGDIKEYRDYQALVARYITGETANEQEVDAAIQRNIKRWEKEAAAQIEKEFIALPSKAPQGAALDEAISRIVQDKIAAFQQRKAGAKAISTDSLKRLARDTMRAKTVKDAMNTRSFLSAMKRAASDERRAILKGDWGAASTANELGRYNYEMVSLSGKVRVEVNKILARSKKTGNSKSIEFAYQEAILHLISRYQLTKQVPTKPTIAPKYDELFAGDEFGYTTFPRPDFLDTDITNYRDLRMEQLTELDNAINYLAGQGKEGKEGLLTTGEHVQDVAERATEDMVGHKKVHEDYTTIGKLVGKSRAYFATSDRMQNVMIALGGYQNIGAKGESSFIETQTVDRIFVADNNEIELHERTRADLKPHFQTIQRSIRRMVKANKKQGGSGHKIKVDGAPVPEILRNRGKQPNWWTPENMFAVALNTGNPSNFKRLMSGYTGLTDEHIDTLIDQLTVEDMDAVQGIWETMASLYDDMDRVFFKLNNYHLDKIEIEPFDFKGKHYEGGYYPAVYDASLSPTVAKREEALRIGKNENAKYQNPYLKSQFTKGRTGGGLPLRLKLNVVNQHFRDAIHYITHAEVVQDVDKIIQNPTFKEAAIDAIGEESYKTLRPSLAHVASPKIAGVEVVDQLVERHRRLASAYMVLANAGIAVKQSFSSGAAIYDVGVKDYALGVGLLMKDPIGRYQTMIDLSTKIRDRKNHFDREFSALSKTFSPEQKQLWFGDKNISVDDIKAVLGWAVRTVDMITVTPAWTGAFEGRLKRNGGDTNEAVLYADNKIRKSQPSAAPIDLPYLQRAGGVLRLLSMFQTWWLKYAERQRLHYNAARKGGISKSDYAWFTFIETIIPAIGSHMLMSLLWGRDLDDDEVQADIMKDTVKSLVINAVPLGGMFFNPYGDPLDSPVGQGLAFSKDILVDSAVYVFGDMTKKQKEQHEIRLMWDFFNVISFYSGIPASQVARKALKGSKQKQGLSIVKHLIPAPKNKQ